MGLKSEFLTAREWIENDFNFDAENIVCFAFIAIKFIIKLGLGLTLTLTVTPVVDSSDRIYQYHTSKTLALNFFMHVFVTCVNFIILLSSIMKLTHRL